MATTGEGASETSETVVDDTRVTPARDVVNDLTFCCKDSRDALANIDCEGLQSCKSGVF